MVGHRCVAFVFLPHVLLIFHSSLRFSILFLDSLRMHRKMHVAKMVMQWLNFEWNRRMKDVEDFIKSPFTRDAIQLVSPKG